MLASKVVTRTGRLHRHHNLVIAQYAHHLVKIGKGDRIFDRPVGNAWRHRPNSIAGQSRCLHADSLMAAPDRKTREYKITRLKPRQGLQCVHWLGHILNGARRMDEMDPSQRKGRRSEIGENLESPLRQLEGAFGHSGRFHNRPTQLWSHASRHPKIMESAAAAEIENRQWPLRD